MTYVDDLLEEVLCVQLTCLLIKSNFQELGMRGRVGGKVGEKAEGRERKRGGGGEGGRGRSESRERWLHYTARRGNPLKNFGGAKK